MNKNKEIIKLRQRLNNVNKEIKKQKKRIPIFFISFISLALISFYIVECKFYNVYGNSIDRAMYIVLTLCFISFIISLISYAKIKSYQKKAQSIDYKLYNLMKLDSNKNA